MPRYYFDVTDSKGFHKDEFGHELAGFEEARQECQGFLPDIAREELPDGDLHTIKCAVRDETGRVIYRGEITYKGEVVTP